MKIKKNCGRKKEYKKEGQMEKNKIVEEKGIKSTKRKDKPQFFLKTGKFN